MTGALDSLNAVLAAQIEAVAVALLGKPSMRSGHNWRWGRKGSMSVAVGGARRGAWHDHEAGHGGDPVGLIARVPQCRPGEAMRWARSFIGDDPRPVRAPVPPCAHEGQSAAPSRTLNLAHRIWREAGPAVNSLVVRYLAARHLSLPLDAPIRYHPRCPRGAERLPVMLALMTDPLSGEPCGVHRTFLRAEGAGKAAGQAKMMCGNGGVIRLTPNVGVTAGLGIAEGIETSLAVMQHFAWSPVWAATSAGAIRAFPVLPGIECLTIFADADDAGHRAADACAARWIEAGREAEALSPPGGDFADLLAGAA